MSQFTGTIDIFFLFCQVAQISAGNALAAVWDFDTGGGETFNEGVRLSANGQEPATHIGVSTVCDFTMKQGIEAAILTGTPWLTGHKEFNDYTFESALIEEDLQVIEEII